VTINKLSQDYKIPDEKLSYSELKDRIREEVTGALPKKERVMLLAKKLEDDLAIKDTICSQICTDFKDLISESYIKKCLPSEYKQKSKQRKKEEKPCATSSANDDNTVSEQKAMTVNAHTGQEAVSEPESEPEPAKPSAFLKNMQTELEIKTKELEEAI
jgi:hypothetical protein